MAAFAVTLLSSAAARADVVPAPPPSCPPGAVGSSDHAGPFCEPTECVQAADCGRLARRRHGWSFTCEEGLGLCVEKVARSDFMDRDKSREVASATCRTDADCTGAKARCVIAKRCIEAAPPAKPDDASAKPEAGPSKCSCRTGPSNTTGWAWWWLGLALLGARRLSPLARSGGRH